MKSAVIYSMLVAGLSLDLSGAHHRANVTDGDTIDKTLLFKNRSVTEKWLASQGVPALGIGFIEDGKIKETAVYGELTKNKKAPLNTIFNVASLAKPVTALIALKLASAGEWNIDEPLRHYWIDPDLTNDTLLKLLNTRHVLSHQSGFPNWRYSDKDKKLKFERAPGTKYGYSGEGYEYLRKALEKKTGKSFEALADELIFKPLSMKDSRFTWSRGMNERRFAQWHKANGEIYPVYKNKKPNAADDLLTTVEDYCRLLIHTMNGANLTPELFKDMCSRQADIQLNKFTGLGWTIYQNTGNETLCLSHGGTDKGVHTIVFLFPESKKGLVIFTNSDTGTKVFIDTIIHYLGETGRRIIDIELGRS